MNELEKLGVKYGTDKVGKHHYLGYYFQLLSYKKKEIKKILEIGTAEGASLFVWRDFFPNAHIYGAEIDPKRVALMAKEKRISMFQCDQSDPKQLRELMDKVGEVDLVIDDGSHKPEDQTASALNIMPYLKKGAIYIIEDVADDRITKYFGNYDWESIRWPGRYDDCIILIKQK